MVSIIITTFLHTNAFNINHPSQHMNLSSELKKLFFLRTPPLLSRVRNQKTKSNRACFYRMRYHPFSEIEPNHLFRASQYDQAQRFRIFGSAWNHSMDRITFCRQKCNLVWFFDHVFSKIIERSGVFLPTFTFQVPNCHPNHSSC